MKNKRFSLALLPTSLGGVRGAHSGTGGVRPASGKEAQPGCEEGTGVVGSWRAEGGGTTGQRDRRPELPGGGTREPGRGQPGGRQGRPGGHRDLRETGQWGGRQTGCPGPPGDEQPLWRPEEPESDKLGVPSSW